MPLKKKFHPPDSQKDVVDYPNQELVDAVKTLYNNPQYSDLLIQCGTKLHEVHQCIVCPRSIYLALECEAGEESITLEGEEPSLVRQMIKYLYTLDYDVDIAEPNVETWESGSWNLKTWESDAEDVGGPSASNESESHSWTEPDEPITTPQTSPTPTGIAQPVQFHIGMYCLADHLGITGLKVLSKQRITEELKTLTACSFQNVAKEIYEPHSLMARVVGDRGLKDLLIKVTLDNLKTLRSRSWTDGAALDDDLLRSMPQFTMDLLIAMIGKSIAY